MATSAQLDLVVNSANAVKSLGNVKGALGKVDTAADKTKKKLGVGGIFGGIGAGAKKALGFLTGPAGLVGGLGALVGAGAGLKGIKDKLDWADNLAKTARQAGLTVESLSGLQYASNQLGVSGDAMAAAMAKFNRRMGDFAQRGSGAAKNALESLGVPQADLNEKWTTGDERFNGILEALMKVEDPAVRAKNAFDIGGIALEKLVTNIGPPTEGFNKLRQEAVQVGAAISTEFAEKAERVNDKMDKLGKTFGAIGIQIAEKLLPRLEPLIDKLLANAPAIVDGVVAAFDGFMVVLDAIMPIIEALWPIIELMFKVLKAGFDLVAPVIKEFAPKLQAMVEKVTEILSALPEFFKEKWDLIVTTMTDTKEKIKEQIEKIVQFFSEMPETITGHFQAIIDGIKQKWQELISWLESKKDALIDSVTGPFAWMYDKIVGGSIVPELVREVIAWMVDMKEGMISNTQEAASVVKSELQQIDQSLNVYQDRILRIQQMETNRQKTNQSLIRQTISLEGQHQSAISQTTNAATSSIDIVGTLTSKVSGFVGGLIDKLTSKLGGFGSVIGGLFKKITGGGIGKIFGKLFGGIGKIFGFARGGYLPAGRVGIVGERGPEFISGPARITPMSGSGMSNPVFNFNITNPQGAAGAYTQSDLNRLAAGLINEARQMMIKEQRYGGVLA